MAIEFKPVKITIVEAFMIETLRNCGVSDHKILEQVTKKDITYWEHLSPDFDFQELINLAEKEKTAFHSIILDGYKIKFVTMNGLKNLLRLKFNISDQNYIQTERGITELDIDENQLIALRQILSKNCVIHELSPANSQNLKAKISITLA